MDAAGQSQNAILMFGKLKDAAPRLDKVIQYLCFEYFYPHMIFIRMGENKQLNTTVPSNRELDLINFLRGNGFTK